MAVIPESEIARRRNRRGAGPAIAISLVVHLVVLAAIGFIVPKPRYFTEPEARPVNVMLLPPLPQLRPHRPPPRPLPQSTPRAQVLPHIHTPLAPPSDTPTSAIPAAPGPTVAEAAKPGASIAPGPLPGEDHPHGVQALLRRSVGCDYATARLTPEEKAACADQFAGIARNAANHDFIPDDKRGAYSIEAAANERRRAAHDQSVPMTAPIGSCSGVGSNFGVGCIPESSMTHIRAH